MIALAAVAMVAMVGTIAMVIDVGMLMIAKRELQNAADAAALSGVWFKPACIPSGAPPPLPPYGCEPGPILSDAEFQQKTNTFLAANSTLQSLCGGTAVAVQSAPGSLNLPQVGTLTVAVKCDVAYAFGRILNLPYATVTANAAAAIGLCDPLTGNVTDVPPTLPTSCRGQPTPTPILITRLVL